jgi:hypothetical protein
MPVSIPGNRRGERWADALVLVRCLVSVIGDGFEPRGAVAGDDEADAVGDVQGLPDGVAVSAGAGARDEADEADDHP